MNKGLLLFWFVLISLFSSRAALAGIEPYENFIKGTIKRNDTLIVKDEKFKNKNFIWSDITNISVDDAISFRITNKAYIAKDFTCTAYLKVEYLTDPGQQHPESKNIELKINYTRKKGAYYKIVDSYAFKGAYWIRIIVDNIYSPEFGNRPPPDFQLTGSININRQYKFDPHQTIRPKAEIVKLKSGNKGSSIKHSSKAKSSSLSHVNTLALSNGLNAVTGSENSIYQLNLAWQIFNTSETDIEWTTADQGSPNIKLITSLADGSAGSPDPVILNSIFLHNASRVTTSGNTYVLSLPYNDDYVLVRMRAVSYTTDGIRILGDWDYQLNDGSYAVWPLSWYQQNLNWQYSAAFAEEGKKKEVVSYFDGTLRGRQTITINNSDNVTVVQENVYDEFGRATASILPAPTNQDGDSPYLHYFKNFNLNSANTPYNAANVYGTTGSVSCEFNPDPLNTTTGSSQYYSSANSFLKDKTYSDKLYNAYIPDAQGYPISVTEYTADNTGRIKLQGGVGKTFQPGTALQSNTTKYYYGKPEQWELDQLFGNDVGFASHYLKNMVVDPNGQISVSYVNASGKTIGTALTGLTPANMDPVQSQVPSRLQTTNILDPSKFVFNASDLVLSATTTYLASVAGPATISYNIQQLIDQYPGGAQSICSNCYYDLTIKVVNDCNAVIYTTTTPVQIGAATGNCNSGGTFSSSFPSPFPQIGEYYITFTLAFSKTVMENYVGQFILQGQANGAVKKQFDFILPYLQALDFRSCLSDCSTCEQTLGTQSNFVQVLTNKIQGLDVDLSGSAGQAFQNWANSEYLLLKAHCDSLSATCAATQATSYCAQYENPMLDDVSPGGQYALFDANGNPLDAANNVINLYWRTAFPVETPTDPDYPLNLITLPDGTTTSPNDASFTLPMLVAYWNTDWATKFLPYHPEYCKLLFCQANENYEEWDQQVQNISKAAGISSIPGAPAGLHYDYTNPGWLVSADPFFQPGAAGAALNSAFQNDLLNYTVNVLNNTTNSPKNLLAYVDYALYCSNSAFTTNSTLINPNSANWDGCSPIASCRVPDREWMLYQNFYFQLKQKYYKQLRSQTTCQNQCQVGVPLVIPAVSSCPATTDFALNIYSPADGVNNAGCDSLHTTMTLSCLPGNLTTPVTVTLSYTSGVVSAGLPTTFVFQPGDVNKFFCVPAGTPALAISIQSVTCPSCQANPLIFNAWQNYVIVQNTYDNNNNLQTTASLPVDSRSFFNGTLTINPDNTYNVVSDLNSYTGTWAMDNNCQFSLFGNNVTYYLNQVSSQQFSLVHKEGNVQEIWQFNSSGSAVNCSSPSSLTVTGTQGSGAYFTGVYPGRHLLTVVSGSSSNQPSFTCNTPSGQPSSTAPQFYPCLNILNGSNTINYQNVWVYDCIYDNAAANCTVSLLTKQSNFYEDISFGMPSAATNSPQQAQSQLAQQVTSTNTAASASWIKALQAGITNPAVIPTLQADLMEVSNLGGDINHPSGSSTTPPGTVTAHGYSSFGDVIKGVTDITVFNTLLNPWLIASPYPYLTPMQYGASTISQGNQGICTLLQQLQATCDSYNAAHGTSLSLFAYLNSVYGTAMTLSAADFQTLQNSCGQCKFLLASDITLPVFLDPTSKGCINASDFSAAIQDLNSQFGSNLSQTDPNYETIFSNFMNQRWGFVLAYYQYSNYQTLLTTNPSAMLCNQAPTVTIDTLACLETQEVIAVASGSQDYNAYINVQKDLFRTSYVSTCSAAQANVNLTAPVQLYHYTLYYYDQADNLVRTVPPEGVNLLSNDQVAQTQTVRTYNPSSCVYTGPMSDSQKSDAFTALSAAITAGSGTIEMWLYDDGTIPNHLVEVTPDNKYLFQVHVSGGQLGMDIYPVALSTATTFTLGPDSLDYRADITALLPLKPFTHLVFQNNLNGGGLPQLFVNGTAVTMTSSSTPIAPGFKTITNNVITLPDSIRTLKHFRFYSQPLSASAIAANAANLCFMPTDQTNITGWYRFNTPPIDGPTTIACTTNETQLLPVYPTHGLITSYAYNSTNQVNTQQSPDGGTNRFWYDLLSRLVISQNDKQLPGQNYSYTTYDPIGRITEVGQKNQTTQNIGLPDYLADATLTSFNAAGTNSQITHTYYDAPAPAGNGIQTVVQNNLRKRVSASTYQDAGAGQVQQATYYNYDIDGNVDTLYQQIAGLDLKQISYEYDLISGKVNFVGYQNGKPDQFYYLYNYDADNRITEAWSSPLANVISYGFGSTLDPNKQRMDASYQYYLHGPLARMELGDVSGKVQGVDYAYTLQGWLKGVNTQDINAGNDIGQDGPTIAQDAYGYSLGYYSGDFIPIGGKASNAFGAQYQQATGDITGQNLYNGNISNSTVAITQINNNNPVGYTYHYDQLNRIKHLRQHTAISTWSSGNITQGYSEDFSFDGNGNILTVNRLGATSSQADNLAYKYNLDANNHLLNNQLNYLNGTGTASNFGSPQQPNNYTYDPIGNLTNDAQSGVSNVQWTVYGKIQSLNTTSGAINYGYDPEGQRATKALSGITTFYVRDAQGNTISVYDNKRNQVNWKEQHLYGSSRLGMWQPNVNLSNNNASAVWDTIGHKQYELTNHLSNVLATLTDSPIPHSSDGVSVDYYLPDVTTAQDYYAFGGLMPNRTFNEQRNYRYGFNGKELDKDIDVDNYDYGRRIYDGRIGRFLSVDPLASNYAYYSSYQYTGNSPIAFNDLDGLERIYYIYQFSGNTGKPVFQKTITQTHEPGVINRIHDFFAQPTSSNVPYPRRASDYNGDLILGIQKVYVLQESDFSQEYNSLGELQKVSQKAFNELRSGDADKQLALTYLNDENLQQNTQPTHNEDTYSDHIEDGVQTIKTEDILFSQQKVNDFAEIKTSMQKNGWKGDPIDVVDLGNGKYGTLDNTRVLAAHEAGIKVEARVHKANEPLNAGEIKRFTTKKGGAPKNWGEAFKNRIGKQSAGYKKANPNGSHVTHGSN